MLIIASQDFLPMVYLIRPMYSGRRSSGKVVQRAHANGKETGKERLAVLHHKPFLQLSKTPPKTY